MARTRNLYNWNYALTPSQNLTLSAQHDAREDWLDSLEKRNNAPKEVTGLRQATPAELAEHKKIMAKLQKSIDQNAALVQPQQTPVKPIAQRPPLTEEQVDAIMHGAGKTAKIFGWAVAGLVAAYLVMAVIVTVGEAYNTATTWIHKKAETVGRIIKGDPEPVPVPVPVPPVLRPAQPVEDNTPSVSIPVQPARKNPPPIVSVYKKLPEGTTALLPQSEYLSDATGDVLGYLRKKSGSTINKVSLMELAKDSAKGIGRPFTEGTIDSNGETLEVIMGTFNGVGRHAVVCLGGKEGIRSVTHMYMGTTPENLKVSFSNSVMTSTGQNIDLTAIANRVSQCHQVTLALHRIDPNLRFVLN